PIPILGIFFFILPLSIKIRINALVIIGLFFVLDLHGGIGQISGSVYSMIGHWAHVCGMLSGILIAVIFKLSNDAVEERHTEIGVKGSGGFTNLGGMAESLNKALDQNPENTEALVHLARIKSKFHVTDEGRELYKKAIAILIRTEPKEATETFKEFYSKYMEGVTPALMHRISGVLYKSGDLDLSARTLEMILDDPSAPIEVRERSMYQLVIILELMCLSEAALRHIDNFIEEFPSSTMIEKATEKKRELTESLLSEKL
ncbi:MAG: hypothetical protein KAR06_10260, partial [Deltaproteobacteria bacterium]|nr:hypothetical protein [Deltaproteobacteria bacterium]